MTSKERVKRAVTFKVPDRIPMEFHALGLSDTAGFGWNQIGTGDKTMRQTLDEWSCTWSRSEVKNMGQVTGHPLNEWEKLKDYKFPNPHDPVFWAGLEEKSKTVNTEKYIKTGIFMVLFERLHSLRGFENLMLDFYINREKLESLADCIVEFDVGIIQGMAQRFPGLVDGIGFTDDWGTEQAAFISTGLFDEIFKPRYKKIFDACHEAGWHVWLHSCGKITKLVPSLIEAGADVLNLQQPRVFGIEEFGKLFAGKTCFSTCVDIQHTLPFKSAFEIEDEARLLLECWGTPNGGIIASDYGDPQAIGVSEEVKKIMFDAFIRYDPYSK